MKALITAIAIIVAGCGGSASSGPTCQTVSDTNRNHVIARRADSVMGNALLNGSRIDIGGDNQSIVTVLHSDDGGNTWNIGDCQ